MEENHIFIRGLGELAELGYVKEEKTGEGRMRYDYTAKATKYKSLFVKYLKEYDLTKNNGGYGIRPPHAEGSFISPLFLGDENRMEFLGYRIEELEEVERKVLEEMRDWDKTTA